VQADENGSKQRTFVLAMSAAAGRVRCLATKRLGLGGQQAAIRSSIFLLRGHK
jgi:hypothetical protein